MTTTSFDGGYVDSPWTTIEKLRTELARVKAKSEERKALLMLLKHSRAGGVLSNNACLFCGRYGAHGSECPLMQALED